MKLTLIKGDGIGPEVIDAAVRCIDAAGVSISWDEQLMGEDAIKKFNTPLPDATIESLKRTTCALKGPVTTPIGGGFRSVNVALRQALDLYANVRPARIYKGIPAQYNAVDLVIIRE